MKITYYDSQIKFVENGENDFLTSNNNEAVIICLNQTEVCYLNDDSCNVQYCEENNIPIIKNSEIKTILQNNGGCIVGVNGNIFINIKVKSDICLSDKFSKMLCQYLKNKGIESVSEDNNDILINGFKVASGCETTYNGWQLMVYQISLYQDINLIENICTKAMVKVPKGLSEYGLTTEELKQFCIDYWTKAQ